ncbi:hypothetical protein [Phormidium sp. CCY1219]|uniref:hypothetical protein n=1 Tax=Phormidium sp. CCY1219 TaxID=2886104 RepID=UPI002D7683A1|nr:hypothetical protein [Phormidium sp. CCY1219]
MNAQDIPELDVPSRCPTDLDRLMADLLPDLPGYANRVIQRRSDEYVPRYVIFAGLPEFEPLPQGSGPNNPPVSRLPSRQESSALTADLQQVFITTLERYYAEDGVVKYEQYHWLFLTPSAEGWRLVLMLSRTAYPQGAIPTPPRDSSDSDIARGIRLWLRDCGDRD